MVATRKKVPGSVAGAATLALLLHIGGSLQASSNVAEADSSGIPLAQALEGLRFWFVLTVARESWKQSWSLAR